MSPRFEDLVDQAGPANLLDRRQEPVRQAVVVRGEEVLRPVGHVVHVARPTHTMPDRLAADQATRLEGFELLQDARPARVDAACQLVG